MASQSDANSSNGKARAGGVGCSGGFKRGERGEMEVDKIRFAFVCVRRGDIFILCMCARVYGSFGST